MKIDGITTLIIALILILSLFLVLEVNKTNNSGFNKTQASNEEDYIHHESIRINSDEELTQTARSEGWPGDGTKNNPFVIAGYEIKSDYSCIYIGNTTKHFVIKDCLLHNTSFQDEWHWYRFSGIYLYHVNNASVKNNIIKNNDMGIQLLGSNKTDIKGNTVSNSNWGIYLYYSNNNTIKNNDLFSNDITDVDISKSDNNIVESNTCSELIMMYSNNNEINDNIINTGGEGLVLASARNCTIKENKMKGYGIGIMGDKLYHWNSHIIGPENTLNGIPVKYIKNRESFSISTGVSQVILANCSQITVEKQYFNGSRGVRMGFCRDISITDVKFYNNVIGFYSFESKNNTISNCKFYNNTDPIYFENSSYNAVYHNNFIKTQNSIYLKNSINNHWYDTRSNEGNYWENYNGTDYDHDGFGNNPKYIFGNKTRMDRFPSMSPYDIEVNPYPCRPMDVMPGKGSKGITVDTQLSVNISDPKGDSLTVSFYDASDNELIDKVNDVDSGDRVMIDWTGLSKGDNYRWYVVIDDGEHEVKSNVYSFTTEKKDDGIPGFTILSMIITSSLTAYYLQRKRKIE